MNFRFLATAVFSFVAITGILQAGTIAIDSQPGLANSITSGTVAITRHPLWQQNNPVNPWLPDDSSAVWISYALTGAGDSQFQPYMGTTPVVSIFHDFTSGAGTLNLRIWADDTAEVFLDGVRLFDPKFTQSVCSGQPIGCQPGDFGTISTSFEAGSHQLEFRLFQVGTGGDTTSNPFGLLYTGTAVSRFDTNPAPAPEPATWTLAGGVLMIAAALRMRSLRRR